MVDSDLKSDKYTIGQAAGNNTEGIVCSDANGNVLFKVTGDETSHHFIGSDGRTIGQVRQDRQAKGLEIYDASNKLVGSVAPQQQYFTLNDASGKAIAIATKTGRSNGFDITSPDSKTDIATISVDFNAQQQGRGGLGGGMGMGGIMGGGMGGMGRMQNNQNAQKRFTISVQNQTLDPFLLLAFAYSLSRQPGAGGGQQRRGGMGGMGGVGMLGGGMILGGLLGGMGGGLGGGMGGRRGGFGRI
jgi:hypothetical protein